LQVLALLVVIFAGIVYLGKREISELCPLSLHTEEERRRENIYLSSMRNQPNF
jgi:hypothetical protein